MRLVAIQAATLLCREVQRRLMLEREVDTLTAAQQDLTRDIEAKDRAIAELTAVQERLSGELDTEVSMRQVDVERLADGIRLNVSDALLFPSGSAELDAKGRSVLTRIAGELDPERQIIAVVGHTDSYMLPDRLRARYATNWELAAARASIVVRALSEAGIPPTSLRAVSRGPFEPVASNETRVGRAQNRRTEIIVRQNPRAQ
jgi:chemotaxis protein MotB